MTTDHDPIEAEAYRPIVETERAADLWLALALRKIARDPQVIVSVYKRVHDRHGDHVHADVTRGVLNAVADHLEGA